MAGRAQERRAAREHALRFLFGIDFTQDDDWERALERYWRMDPEETAALAADSRVRRYAEALIIGVCTNLERLDQRIGAALENWTPDRVGYVERAILRTAAFEMLHRDDVPATVAINEAIEIAKLYGTDDTPRFVNGVLDRLREQSMAAE